jgi:hypothetical protein
MNKRHVVGQHRQKLLRTLRHLVRDSGSLPPSFFLQGIVSDKQPIAGGGYSVRDYRIGTSLPRWICL